MASTTATPAKSNGLATCLAVITSPGTAFDQLRLTPTWGWAALVCLVLSVVGGIISMPEQIQVAHVAQMHAIANMPADQQAQARQGIAAGARLIPIFVIVTLVVAPWIVWLISAIVYTIGAAISGASARFNLAWVISVNVGVIAFVVLLVNAIILALRGPDAIASPLDAQAIPSLGMFFHDNIKLATFLNNYSIGYIWVYVVAVIGLVRTMSMKVAPAIITVVLYSLIASGIGAAFAR